MRTLLLAAACAGAVLGARSFRNYLSQRGKRRLQEKRIQVWEGEGGAIPVARERSAAQVSPSSAPPLSPRDVN